MYVGISGDAWVHEVSDFDTQWPDQWVTELNHPPHFTGTKWSRYK